MSLVINSNIAAMDAHRNLVNSGNAMAKSMQRLSSGLRINSAADDAAGLAISQSLTGQVNGLDQAQRNVQDGISLVQTADGTLNNVQQMLQRVGSSPFSTPTGTLSTGDKAAISSGSRAAGVGDRPHWSERSVQQAEPVRDQRRGDLPGRRKRRRADRRHPDRDEHAVLGLHQRVHRWVARPRCRRIDGMIDAVSCSGPLLVLSRTGCSTPWTTWPRMSRTSRLLVRASRMSTWPPR